MEFDLEQKCKNCGSSYGDHAANEHTDIFGNILYPKYACPPFGGLNGRRREVITAFEPIIKEEEE